jgi:hypothetical protein
MKNAATAGRQENIKQMHPTNFFSVLPERIHKQSSLESEIKWININEASENKVT